MSFISILKRYSIFRWLVGALCAVLLVSTMPKQAAAQDIAEYALLAAFISLILVSTVVGTGGFNNAKLRLADSADAAAQANREGDRPKEIGKLGKVNGAAHAMLGMTSSCDDTCDEVRGDLQDVVGITAVLKARAVGHSSDCVVNGVVGFNEECDPMAVPTGCGFRTSFCDDECQCQIIAND